MEKELQLQPRLQCIASLVPQGARLADVGTDHGYLPVWLLQHGRIESAIASDINALPLDHARATAREYSVTERMDFRLCPGLAKIKAEECDAIAIAGMGGETILGILDAAPWTHEGVHTLILQPQTKVDLLRCWLCGHGYRFLSETLVRDKGAALRRLPCESGNGAGAERSGRADRLIAAVRPAVRRIPVAASYKAQSGERRPRRLVARR